MSKPTPISLFALAVLLTACSEYELEPAGDPAEEPTDLWGGDGGSAWDDVEPGTVPDAWFAVAWREVIDSCPACDEPNWGTTELRYDIIDARGTVVRSFSWPDSTEDLYHLSMSPAGAGRFIVTARVEQADGTTDRRTWLVVDEDESVNEILRVAPDGLLTLPVAGREIDLGSVSTNMHVSPDPLWPERLYLMADDASDGESRVGPIFSIDWADPLAVVRTWSPPEWLPEGVHDGADGPPGFPWTVQATYDGDRTRLLIGLDGVVDAKWGSESRSSLLSWAPSAPGEAWALDVTDLAVREEPSWIGDGDGSPEGTALFQVGGQSLACAPPEFSLRRSDARLEVSGAFDVDCAWAGPLLDPIAPTFVYHGFNEKAQTSNMGHVLHVSHAGDDVWTVDRFAEGMGEARFLLREAISLEAR